MTRMNRSYLPGLFLIALMMSSHAKADVVNGSFESFFADWTTVGPNTATSGIAGVAPTDGNLMAYLSSGPGALPLAVHGFIVDNDLGLSSGDFSNLVNSLSADATEGATLYQSFFLDGSSGTELTFDWNFLSNEPNARGFSYNDFGFYALLDSSNAVVASGVVDVFGSTFVGASAPYNFQTGWQTVSISGLSVDNYALIFGVFDATDTFFDSALLVDNIRVVPEPSSALLLGFTSLAFAGFRRRRS